MPSFADQELPNKEAQQQPKYQISQDIYKKIDPKIFHHGFPF